MPLMDNYKDAAQSAVRDQKAAVAKLNQDIQEHNSEVQKTITVLKPILDCLEAMRSLDAERFGAKARSNAMQRFRSAPGVDFDFYAPLAKREQDDPLRRPELLRPSLVIKYGMSTPFTEIYERGSRIHVGYNGNASEFFKSQFIKDRSVKMCAAVPYMYILFDGDKCDIVTSTQRRTSSIYSSYIPTEEIYGVDVRQLAEKLVEWLGKAAPDRAKDFAPMLKKLDAELPPAPETLPSPPNTSPAVKAKARGFWGWFSPKG